MVNILSWARPASCLRNADLNKRGKDIKKFIEKLEAWIILSLAEFNIVGQRRSGRVGIWIERLDKPKNADGLLGEEKIAAIGVRVRKWMPRFINKC